MSTASSPKPSAHQPSGPKAALPPGPQAERDGPPGDKAMPLMSHLIELRTRLLYSLAAFVVLFFVAFYWASPLFNFLAEPLLDSGILGDDPVIIYTAMEEKFFVNVRLSFFSAVFLSFPLIASQIWLFVAPGLYRHEQDAFLPFLIATPIMFVAGGAFAYYVAIPVAWEFFGLFQQAFEPGQVAVELVPRASEYLATTMVIILGFGIAFLTPVLLTLLIRAGLMSADALARNRRYAILAVFVMAAILTPPDPVSQIGLAVPMLLMMEAAIIIGRRIEAARARRLAAVEAAL